MFKDDILSVKEITRKDSVDKDTEYVVKLGNKALTGYEVEVKVKTQDNEIVERFSKGAMFRFSMQPADRDLNEFGTEFGGEDEG